MIEIDGQSLNLVDMSDPPTIVSSNTMAAAIAIGNSSKLTSPLVVEAGVKRPIMTESLLVLITLCVCLLAYILYRISDTAIPRKKSRVSLLLNAIFLLQF